MANDKKKDIFSFFSDAFDSFKNILLDVGQKAKDVSSKAISFAKEKAKSIIDRGLDFFKRINLPDIDDYTILKSKKILFDVREGIISLVEGRVGQHLIIYIRLPDASIPVFFSPTFVNIKEWVARKGVKNVNPLFLKRLSYVKLMVEYTKKTYIEEKESDDNSYKKQKKAKEIIERFVKKDVYIFPRPIHNLTYRDIALTIYSYVKDEIDQGAYRSIEYGGVHSSGEIIDMRIFVE